MSSPDPSAVASRITLAPRYFLSGWGSGRSLYSSIPGRYLLGMFQPSPVAPRVVVSAIRNPPSRSPAYPCIPHRILIKHPLCVNEYLLLLAGPKGAIFSPEESVFWWVHARGHNRR